VAAVTAPRKRLNQHPRSSRTNIVRSAYCHFSVLIAHFEGKVDNADGRLLDPFTVKKDQEAQLRLLHYTLSLN
jgi:hypothetical protein